MDRGHGKSESAGGRPYRQQLLLGVDACIGSLHDQHIEGQGRGVPRRGPGDSDLILADQHGHSADECVGESRSIAARRALAAGTVPVQSAKSRKHESHEHHPHDHFRLAGKVQEQKQFYQC